MADVREVRKALGLTQAELAARLGTDAVTVSRWERGVSEPRPATRRRLSMLAQAPSLDFLIEAVGPAQAERVLRREYILNWRPTNDPDLSDADARIRATDRARREQLAFKEGTRAIDEPR